MATSAKRRWFSFQLRSLLFAMTVTALWLSTFVGYNGSNDVQAFIWAAIVVTSGIAAGSSKGARRAFWAGFCSTMLLTSMRTVFSVYGAKLSWTINIAREWGHASPSGVSTGQQVLNFNNTLIFVTLLASATAIGFLSAVVYGQCTEEAED